MRELKMIRIGIVGTGNMAHVHADAFNGMRGVKLVAGCDVMEDKVKAFAERHRIPATFTDVDTMLREVEMDAISNVTPDAFHAPIALKAIRKGLHVLSEKPLAVNYADAKKMADAARRKGIINMVNLSYRNSAAIHRAHKLVQQGVIGELRHVEAGYLQGWLSGMDVAGIARRTPHRLWRLCSELGSKGVLGDLGVHILDFASYPAGDIKSVNCRLKTFEKVKGNRAGDLLLDANDTAIATVEFASGAVGTVHTTRWATGQSNSIRLRIYGTEGAIVVDLDKSYTDLEICRKKRGGGTEWTTIKCAPTPSIYQRFVKSVKTGKNDQPDFARGAQIQKALDACFESNETGKVVRV
jgi:predicted dehydrogenase